MITRSTSRSRQHLPFLALISLNAALALSIDVGHPSAKQPVSGAQRFTVHLPPRTGVVPPASVGIIHDQTDRAQAFPPQRWRVHTSATAGMSVGIGIDAPFTHVEHAEIQRDAKLFVGVPVTGRVGKWSIATSEGSDVQITSDGPGHCVILVDLELAGTAFELLPAGEYATNVLCTITSP